MLRYVHTLASILFYALGAAAFAAYVLVRNDIFAQLALRVLQSIDLPLLAAGLLLGGASVLLSLRNPSKGVSLVIALGIAVPLLVLFLGAVIVNFAF